MAICGIANTNGIRPIAEQMKAMASAMSGSDGRAHSQWVDREAGLCVSSILNGTSIHSAGRFLVACDSDLYNRQELEHMACLPPGTTQADLIAELYLRKGEDFVKDLDGVFSRDLG